MRIDTLIKHAVSYTRSINLIDGYIENYVIKITNIPIIIIYTDIYGMLQKCSKDIDLSLNYKTPDTPDTLNINNWVPIQWYIWDKYKKYYKYKNDKI